MQPISSLYNFMKKHISPITGIVWDVRALPVPYGDDVFHIYTARHAATSNVDSLEAVYLNQVTLSSAISRSKEEAEALSVFEALERWSSIADGTESTHKASYQDLRRLHLGNSSLHLDAVWINEIQLFSEKQEEEYILDSYALEALTSREEKIAWIRAWSINSETWKWVPATACLFGWKDDEKQDSFADSRGVAAGPTLDFCVWNGLLELIQTDAVAIWHANRLRKPGVDLESFASEELVEVIQVHNCLHRDIWVIDVSSDIEGICVMAAISRDQRSGNVVKGFGSDPDPAVSLHRAIMECSQMLPNVVGPGQQEEVVTQGASAFNTHDYLVPHAGLPPRTLAYYRNTHQAVETIGGLSKVLSMHNMECLVIDLTRPDIGLPVARVIVPGLRSWFNRLAPGRLYTVPVLTGERIHPLAEQDMNQLPIEDWSITLHGDAVQEFLTHQHG